MSSLSSVFTGFRRNTKLATIAGIDRILSELSIKPTIFDLSERAVDDSSFVNLNTPCVIRGLTSHWPAVKDQRWSLDNLRKLYGRKYFQCGSYGDESDPFILSLREYLDRHVLLSAPPQDSFSGKPKSPNPLYLFDPTFDQDNEVMLTDYEIPAMFQLQDKISNCLPVSRRPNYRWFLIGPQFSGSDLHIDPLFTSAWNTTTSGHKLWLIIEPLIETRYHGSSSSFYFDTSALDSYGSPSNVEDELHCEQGIESYLHWFQNKVPTILKTMLAKQPERRIYLFVQEPGETVYIPSQWMHAVLNLNNTVAITHNFIQPQHISDYMREYQTAFEISDEETQSIIDRMNVVAEWNQR